MTPIFALDFSLNKPAMITLINGKASVHVFPIRMDSKSESMLNSAEVETINRNLPKIKEACLNENDMIMEHIRRANSLSKIILETINSKLNENGIYEKHGIIISNEGFSFGSNGDATLDLSGYKYILMNTLISEGFDTFRTYSPMTLKSTAGCARKGMGKKDMIYAAAEDNRFNIKVLSIIINSPQSLMKKTAFIDCIDDIADAYWCMITTLKKEYMI